MSDLLTETAPHQAIDIKDREASPKSAGPKHRLEGSGTGRQILEKLRSFLPKKQQAQTAENVQVINKTTPMPDELKIPEGPNDSLDAMLRSFGTSQQDNVKRDMILEYYDNPTADTADAIQNSHLFSFDEIARIQRLQEVDAEDLQVAKEFGAEHFGNPLRDPHPTIDNLRASLEGEERRRLDTLLNSGGTRADINAFFDGLSDEKRNDAMRTLYNYKYPTRNVQAAETKPAVDEASIPMDAPTPLPPGEPEKTG